MRTKKTSHQVFMEKRAKKVGKHICKTKCTIRECANDLGLKKSTVSQDTARLIQIDVKLYNDVRKVILKNKEERHIRAGRSTKLKYQALSKSQNKHIAGGVKCLTN